MCAGAMNGGRGVWVRVTCDASHSESTEVLPEAPDTTLRCGKGQGRIVLKAKKAFKVFLRIFYFDFILDSPFVRR